MRSGILLLAAVLVFLSGCGGGGGNGDRTGGGGGGGNPISVAIAPTSASLALNGSQQFTASVTNSSNQAVNWSVQEGAAGGAVSASGLYQAPHNSAGTFHVQAASQADPTKTSSSVVTVHLGVSVSPTPATLTLGQSQSFTATVTGSSNAAVNWSVQEGEAGGTITAAGVYTAPTNAGGTFHVVAVSQADPTESATAVITVQAGSATYIIQ